MDRIEIIREIIECESAYISDIEKEERIKDYLNDELTEHEALEGIIEY